MTNEFWDLMRIREQTVSARERIRDLKDAGILDRDDYSETCFRFSKTWWVVHDFMEDHGMISC